MMTETKNKRRRQSEGSFTLIETMIALTIISFVIIGVSGVQGNSIVFSDYGRNVTQATWLARRVMSQVDYYWKTKPFKDLETEVREQKFEDFPEYSYTLEIKEWKFPFEKMLTMAMGGGIGADEEAQEEAEEKKEDDGGMSGMIETISKQVFGDEPKFLTAYVAVSWSEGAARNQSSMTYLLTNQVKIDEAIVQLKPVYDKLTKPPPAKNDPKKRPPKPGDPANPNAGGDAGGGTDAAPPDTGDTQ